MKWFAYVFALLATTQAIATHRNNTTYSLHKKSHHHKLVQNKPQHLELKPKHENLRDKEHGFEHQINETDHDQKLRPNRQLQPHGDFQQTETTQIEPEIQTDQNSVPQYDTSYLNQIQNSQSVLQQIPAPQLSQQIQPVQQSISEQGNHRSQPQIEAPYLIHYQTLLDPLQTYQIQDPQTQLPQTQEQINQVQLPETHNQVQQIQSPQITEQANQVQSLQNQQPIQYVQFSQTVTSQPTLQTRNPIQTQTQRLQIPSQVNQGLLQLNQVQRNVGQRQRTGEQAARVLSYQFENNGQNYQYAYETENGIRAQEVGTVSNGTVAQGAYSYRGDDGQTYTVQYTADENGFRPQGAHLPTPPPIPEAIANSIERNARDEAVGIFDDGQYRPSLYATQNVQQQPRRLQTTRSQQSARLRPTVRPNIIQRQQPQVAQDRTQFEIQFQPLREIQQYQVDLRQTQPQIQQNHPQFQQIQPRTQKSQLNQIQPQFEQTQPWVQQNQPQVQLIQSQLEQAQSRLQQTQRQLNQIQPQFEQNQLWTQQTQPQIQYQLEETQPQLQQYQLQFNQFQPKYEQTQPRLQQTQPQLHQIQPQLEQTQIQLQQTPSQFQQMQPHLPQTQLQQSRPQYQQSQPRLPQTQSQRTRSQNRQTQPRQQTVLQTQQLYDQQNNQQEQSQTFSLMPVVVY